MSRGTYLTVNHEFTKTKAKTFLLSRVINETQNQATIFLVI